MFLIHVVKINGTAYCWAYIIIELLADINYTSLSALCDCSNGESISHTWWAWPRCRWSGNVKWGWNNPSNQSTSQVRHTSPTKQETTLKWSPSKPAVTWVAARASWWFPRDVAHAPTFKSFRLFPTLVPILRVTRVSSQGSLVTTLSHSHVLLKLYFLLLFNSPLAPLVYALASPYLVSKYPF